MVHIDHIAVTANYLCTYNTDGEFLGYVGNSDGSSFESPWFIMSDKFNKLYISCSNGVTTY